MQVFDATNTTRERRKLVEQRCKDNTIEVKHIMMPHLFIYCQVFFIEMVCNDDELVAENIKVSLAMPPVSA